MGTLITWVLVHAAPPGGSCQTVRVLAWTARASAWPPVPGASVAVPAGRAGSACHWLPAPAISRRGRLS